ncbi:hypothetical protein FKM82_026600 [Ascaphus truei]
MWSVVDFASALATSAGLYAFAEEIWNGAGRKQKGRTKKTDNLDTHIYNRSGLRGPQVQRPGVSPPSWTLLPVQSHGHTRRP